MTPPASLRAHVARQLPGYGYCDACAVWTATPCARCAAHARLLATVRAATPARRVDTDTSPAADCLFRHDLTVAAAASTEEECR